jgi:DNA repair protein RadC
LPLDAKGRAKPVRIVSIGSLTASVVHPREVFSEALAESAASIIVAHNHPSNDPTPSPEDIAVTRKLVRAGEVMGIPVLDHLIIGNPGVSSLKELGLMSCVDEDRARRD